MTQQTFTGVTSAQIVKRYNGRKKVWEELKRGRKLSLLDSQEFELAEFHNAITNIRKDIREKSLPYILKGEWMQWKPGKRCKRYWLEDKEVSNGTL